MASSYIHSSVSTSSPPFIPYSANLTSSLPFHDCSQDPRFHHPTTLLTRAWFSIHPTSSEAESRATPAITVTSIVVTMPSMEDARKEFSGLAVTSTVDSKKETAIQCLQNLAVPFIDSTSPTWVSQTTAYNLRIPAVPALIVFAKTPQHVQDAVACGVKTGLKVSARCGNHSYSSLGNGGENNHLIVDVAALSNVTVDRSTHVATVGAGARLGHVATELHNQGRRGIAHGSCPGVGIAGHLLHGGYGWASHNKGLALDSMIGATIVLANGIQVRCTSTENTDLFWALRGAGSNFGIVTSFELKTFEAPTLATPFKATLDWNTEEKKVEGVKALVQFARTAPADLNMRRSYNPIPLLSNTCCPNCQVNRYRAEFGETAVSMQRKWLTSENYLSGRICFR